MIELDLQWTPLAIFK